MLRAVVFTVLVSLISSVVGDGWLLVVPFHGSEDIDVYVSETQVLDANFQQLGAELLNVQYEPTRFLYYLLKNQRNSSYVSENNQVLFTTPSVLFVSVSIEQKLNFLARLPPNDGIVAIFPKPYVARVFSSAYLETLASTPLKRSDAIQALVDQVSEDDLRNFVEYLSGELKGSPIQTRNSFSEGAVVASKWLMEQFTQFGFNTSLQCFENTYSCNVVATLRGVTLPSEVIVLGAHYDSRASDISSPTQRAPGANDDGSGTGTLLQIAKIISQSKTQFARSIHIVAFSGEEQGTVGSQAYARLMVEQKVNVVAMLQNDMIAYRAPGAGLLCGFPNTYTTPSLTTIAISATNTYSPTIITGRNNRCCSDHRSFYIEGFHTTDFSDTIGPIVDPEYHSSGDLVNRPGFDLTKYAGIVKGYFATAIVVAELA